MAPHYALVCASTLPLALEGVERVRFDSLTNLASGRPVGASQVTAVVRSARTDRSGDYPVDFRARLVYPYFLRLRQPVVVDSHGAELRARLASLVSDLTEVA